MKSPSKCSVEEFTKGRLSMDDFDTTELNEAFAAQAIACIRELKCDMEKTNVLGSGISIGHPIGCTGARIIVTLMGESCERSMTWALPPSGLEESLSALLA